MTISKFEEGQNPGIPYEQRLAEWEKKNAKEAECSSFMD
jgi:hypothetical protein